jgi:hypothetical protein
VALGWLHRLVRGALSVLRGHYLREASEEPSACLTAWRELQGTHGQLGPSDKERPVFLLGVGWRTGSTLLQRVLMTDQRLLLWGEPYGPMGLIPRMTESLAQLSRYRPGHRYFLKNRDAEREEFSTSWIANLYPDVWELRASLQALVVEWLAKPAIRAGYSRWGLKEVRLTSLDASFLWWLFPNAQFVVVARHPVDVYRSLLGRGRLYYQWPDRFLEHFDPVAFGRHWAHVALGWAQPPKAMPVTLLKHEDVTAGRLDTERLGRHLGLNLDPSKAIGTRVGGTKRDIRLAPTDRFLVRWAARKGMRVFGYD